MNKSTRVKNWVRKQRFKKAERIDNSKFLPEGIDRVYHIHIRKSAGSSLNNLFFAQADLTLKELWREPLYIKNGRVFVQHQKEPINRGNYYYASSHYPVWDLQLPPKTFTYCILRDPVDRLVSLYKYYCWVAQVDDKTGYANDPSYFVLLAQQNLLNKSFIDFVNELSPKYLYSQLFTFDKDLNPVKGIELLKQVNKVYFFDELNFAINDLVDTLALKPAPLSRERSFKNVSYTVTSEDRKLAAEILAPEIEFYNKARQLYFRSYK